MKTPSLLLLATWTLVLAGCQAASTTPTEPVANTSLEPAEQPIVSSNEALPEEPIATDTTTRQFTSSELSTITAPFNFTATIPAAWQVEYVPEIEAINFYDPTIEATSALEQSQIFVRYFTAASFLTLSTVTIYSQTETTINNRPVVVYDIEKKPEVADFTHQPSWRNQRHVVTDIRSTNNTPATFYVFGKRPELSQEVFDQFIQSVQFQ